MTGISNFCNYYAVVATSLYKQSGRPFTPTNITPFYTRFICKQLSFRVSRVFVTVFRYGGEDPAWVRWIYVKRSAVRLAGVWQSVPLVKVTRK